VIGVFEAGHKNVRSLGPSHEVDLTPSNLSFRLFRSIWTHFSPRGGSSRLDQHKPRLIFIAQRRIGNVGFKSAKSVQAISVTNTYPGGYWEDRGYNWFSGSADACSS
jgi:hypothetical protein